MIRRPPRSTLSSSSAASDVYKRQVQSALREAASSREKRISMAVGEAIHAVRTQEHLCETLTQAGAPLQAEAELAASKLRMLQVEMVTLTNAADVPDGLDRVAFFQMCESLGWHEPSHTQQEKMFWSSFCWSTNEPGAVESASAELVESVLHRYRAWVLTLRRLVLGMAGQDSSAMFQALDVPPAGNGDGLISADEFVRGLETLGMAESKHPLREGHLQQAFSALDIDGSGALQREEFVELLKAVSAALDGHLRLRQHTLQNDPLSREGSEPSHQQSPTDGTKTVLKAASRKSSKGTRERVKNKLLSSGARRAATKPLLTPSMALGDALEEVARVKDRLTRVLASMSRRYPKVGFTAPEVLAAFGAVGVPAFSPPHQANAMLLCEHLQWAGPHNTVTASEIFNPDAYFLELEDAVEPYPLWRLQKLVGEYVDETKVGMYDLFMAMDRSRSARLTGPELQHGLSVLFDLHLTPNTVRELVRALGAARCGVSFGLFYKALEPFRAPPSEAEEAWGRFYDSAVTRMNRRVGGMRVQALLPPKEVLERVERLISDNRYGLYDVFVQLGAGHCKLSRQDLATALSEKGLLGEPPQVLDKVKLAAQAEGAPEDPAEDTGLTVDDFMAVLDPEDRGTVTFQAFFKTFGSLKKPAPKPVKTTRPKKRRPSRPVRKAPAASKPSTSAVTRVHEALSQSPHNLFDIFLWMDGNADGTISRNELREGLRRELGLILSIDDCDQIITASGAATQQLQFSHFFKIFGSTARDKRAITPAIARRRLMRPGSVVATINDALQNYLVETGEKLHDLFDHMDTSQASSISDVQLQRGLAKYVGLGMRRRVATEFVSEVMASEDTLNKKRLTFGALFKIVGHGATSAVKGVVPHSSLNDVTADDLQALELFLQTRALALADSEAQNNLTPAARQALHMLHQATKAIEDLEHEQLEYLGMTHDLAKSFS
eukprot:TRINITY_DN11426_c0_g2_i2.p1 TRINITY_DN11426_c0_g2~~TRINITY_DN11426_c0_g2_i2.p1  ORF type:complete len:950 (+),score=216.22 TRINITY_DN11426_c0_g2_i2:94-2943(+)